MNRKKQWISRILIGGLVGLAVMLAVAFFLNGITLFGGAPDYSNFVLVAHAPVERFGSYGLAVAVQSALVFALGAAIGVATLPFAGDGRALVLRSLLHFVFTEVVFSLLLTLALGVDWQFLPVWLAVLLVIYLLIWLGRWIGWYMEVVQLRILLGLEPGPTPLKWRETLPYLPFVLLVCDLLPLALWWIDRNIVVDVPVFSGLILPLLLLPIIGFCSGLSLGKRQGVCPLYPVACFVCYLPMVYLLFNGSALFHCFMVAVPALAGNVLGWVCRRAAPKQRKETGS